MHVAVATVTSSAVNLYEHRCAECGNTIGYTQEQEPLPKTVCNDCASSFVQAAKLMGATVFGESGDIQITMNSIVQAKWRNDEQWEYFTRVALNQWQMKHKNDLPKV